MLNTSGSGASEDSSTSIAAGGLAGGDTSFLLRRVLECLLCLCLCPPDLGDSSACLLRVRLDGVGVSSALDNSSAYLLRVRLDGVGESSTLEDSSACLLRECLAGAGESSALDDSLACLLRVRLAGAGEPSTLADSSARLLLPCLAGVGVSSKSNISEPPVRVDRLGCAEACSPAPMRCERATDSGLACALGGCGRDAMPRGCPRGACGPTSAARRPLKGSVSKIRSATAAV